MFKKSLQEKLTKIFGMPRASFDSIKEPNDAKEQECIFIDVDNVVSKIEKGTASARVNGTISIFAQSSKLPYGFFNKKIAAAQVSDHADFYFHKFDQSEEYFGNLVKLKCEFVYFFRSAYDPEYGEITSVDFAFASNE